MTVFSLAVTPNSVHVEFQTNTGLAPSPLIASTQTIDRGGLKWGATLTFLNLRGANRAEYMAMLAELEGMSHRLRVNVYDNPKRGAYGGTPLVDLGSQTGSSLNVKGASINVTNWIRRGDYFSVDVNGEHELKIATADASTDGTGDITLNFKPRLRASPLNNAAIWVEDGVLSRPQGVFMLEQPINGWDSRPGAVDKLGNATLRVVEDVFATQ